MAASSNTAIAFALLTGINLYSAPGLSAAERVSLPLPADSNRSAQLNYRPFEYQNPEFWLDQCRLLGQGADHQATLESCEQAILLQSDNSELIAELWTTRALALFNLGLYPQAMASLNQVLQVAPDNSQALAYQCAALGAEGQYLKAVDTCELALQGDGEWGDRAPAFAWHQQGLALQQLGRLDDAMASFEQAEQAQPDNPEYRASICALAAELGDTGPCSLEDAVVAYEQAITLQPENARLWFAQGLVLEQLGAYERAVAAYDRAVTLTPQDSLALAHQCGTLNQLGQHEDALAACQAAFTGNQQWGRGGPSYGWVQQSSALIGLGQFDLALAAAERAVVLTIPGTELSYPPAYNNLAVGYWHLGQLDQAQEAMDIALQQFEAYRPLLDDTVERQYPDPTPLFYRGWAIAHYNQGRILASTQDYPGAISAYRRAIDLDRVFIPAEAWTNLAGAYIQANSPSDAVLATRVALAYDGASFLAWYNRGLAELNQGQYMNALNAYNQANQLIPDNIYVLTGQGMALAQLGCTQFALDLFNEVLQLSPRYPLAEQERARLLAQRPPNGVPLGVILPMASTCPALEGDQGN